MVVFCYFLSTKICNFLPLLINLLLLLKYKCAILEFLLCIIALETPEVSPLYLGEGATLKKFQCRFFFRIPTQALMRIIVPIFVQRNWKHAMTWQLFIFFKMFLLALFQRIFSGHLSLKRIFHRNQLCNIQIQLKTIAEIRPLVR